MKPCDFGPNICFNALCARQAASTGESHVVASKLWVWHFRMLGYGSNTHATGSARLLLRNRQFLSEQLQRRSLTRFLNRGFGLAFWLKLIFAINRHGGLRKRCRAEPRGAAFGDAILNLHHDCARLIFDVNQDFWK